MDVVLKDKDAAGKPNLKALHEQKLELVQQLGWHHWAALLQAQIQQSFPADFALI